MLKKSAIILVVGIYSFGVLSTDYCNTDLCANSNHTHIACNNTRKFGRICPKDRELINIGKYKGLIVGYHNWKRNITASGDLPGFDPAERMGSLRWNSELAYLAELNSKRCFFHHDDCRNTDEFFDFAQSIYIQTFSKFHTKHALTFMLRGWFNEYKDANMSSIIDEDYEEEEVVGHFLNFIYDRHTDIGCAATKFTRKQRPTYYFVCNYGSLHPKPIYKIGPTTSKCKTGSNKYFPALCSIHEIYENEDDYYSV